MAAGIVSTIGVPAVGWFIPAQLGSIVAAGIASLLGLLLPLGVGIVLAARKGTPTRRGLGLGLIIGWALAPVIFAGVCIVVISSLNAAARP